MVLCQWSGVPITTASMLAIVQDAAVVGHFRGGGAGDLAGLQHARFIDVADRDHLVAGQPLQQAHQAAGAAARADHADADPVVRALSARGRHAGTERQPGGSHEEGAAVAEHVSPSLSGPHGTTRWG